MGDLTGVVAILFTDLVGSTEVLDRLGDDAAEELRRTHFSLLRRAVADADGTEVKSLGDGLMVTFASPVQAVSCAVEMQRAIAEHNRAEPGQTLQVRVGLNVGDPVRADDDVHGTAVVVAKRLCDRADGGQILASDLVAGLVGRRGEFRFRSAGRLKLKGLSEATPALTVEWRDAQPSSAVQALPRPKGPPGHDMSRVPGRALVGRHRELGRIQEAMGEAGDGRGQIVFVVGPMGIGKTRLVEEALSHARNQGFAVLVGRTPVAGSGLAYAPVLSAFGGILRSVDHFALEELVGDLPHLGRLWPELRLPPPAPIQDPDLERALLFEAVARLLERLSAKSPVLLFVDDLHWADAPSLGLLGYLVSTVTGSPVALAGTYRPEGVLENKALRQFVTNARRSGTVTELALRGLDADGVADLAAGILGDAAPRSVLDLSARAAGTPLFVEALIGGLVDAGSLVRTDGGWALTGERATALPQSVQDLVVGRLDLLTEEERATVELIAHGAQGLSHDVLEQAGGLSADELLTVVRRLGEAGLLIQEDAGPEVSYRLGHPLIQEVAAAELPAVASRRLHARLARTIEELRPRDLDSLAFHYRRAGNEVDRDRALDVLLAAGERARGLSAHEEAARHFGAALPLIRDGQRPELLAEVLERLGDSWEPLGETAAAMQVWTEAADELYRGGDVRGVARLHRRLAWGAHSTGDMATAVRYADVGIAALKGHDPFEELFALHVARFLIAPPLEDPEAARETSVELMRMAESLGTVPARTEALIAGVSLLYIASDVIIDPREIAAQCQEALRIAEEAGDWLMARRALRDLGWLALYSCDHAEMRHHALAVIDIDRRLGDIAHEPSALFQLGYAELVAGRLDESLRIAEKAVTNARRHDQRRALAMSLAQLALAEIHRGDVNAAEEHLNEAQQVFPQLNTDPRGRLIIAWSQATFAFERGDLDGVRRTAGRLHPPMSRILLGTAQVLAGDLEQAALTHASMAAAGARGAPYPAALADRLLGLIERAQGDSDSARAHLERSAATLDGLALPFDAAVSRLEAGMKENVSQALAVFEALGAARYADKARRALRALGVRIPSARSGRDADGPLSRREMEVAGLVAEGLTNSEIAERLVLSVRTVESHLDHVYARLGMSSRAALARWVTEGRATTP